MEKLTKEQKLKVVKDAYKRWKEGYSKFMCINLKVSLKEVLDVSIDDSDDVPLCIPELLDYKPRSTYGAITWWELDEDGMKTRDKVFQELINDLSPDKGFWSRMWFKIRNSFKRRFH